MLSACFPSDRVDDPRHEDLPRAAPCKFEAGGYSEETGGGQSWISDSGLWFRGPTAVELLNAQREETWPCGL